MRIKIRNRWWRIEFVQCLPKGWYGECDNENKVIRILDSLRGQGLTETLYHEVDHAFNWTKREKKVREQAKVQARLRHRPEIQERL